MKMQSQPRSFYVLKMFSGKLLASSFHVQVFFSRPRKTLLLIIVVWKFHMEIIFSCSLFLYTFTIFVWWKFLFEKIKREFEWIYHFQFSFFFMEWTKLNNKKEIALLTLFIVIFLCKQKKNVAYYRALFHSNVLTFN